MDSIGDASNIITKLVSAISTLVAAGPAGWIIGGILIIGVGVISFILWRKKNEIAHKQTEAGRTDDQGTTPEASQGPENAMNQGEAFVDANKSTEVKPKRPRSP